jgi:hypothetical protein
MKTLPILVAACVITHPAAVNAQNAAVNWSALSGGFAITSGQSGRMLSMSEGQSFAGTSSGPVHIAEAGFLTYPWLSDLVVSVPIAAGWNMISKPVTTANDSVHHVYPTASFLYAFGFVPSTGYVQQYRMSDGLGFWEKFPASATASIGGTARSLDSIPVSPGWNMIGSVSSPIDTATITTAPPGIRASQYFGYSGGYSAAQTIVPGRAYWVKSNAAGKFILSTTLLAQPAASGSAGLDRFNSITITDARGSSQTLYIGEDVGFPVDMFEMPPPGPEGVFDTRFESQRMVEICGARAARPIVLRSAVYPVRVSWNIVSTDGRRTFDIEDGINGALLQRKEIAGTGQLTIADPVVNRLILSTGTPSVPAEFSLEQNYPNPFNPNTSIPYSLPERSMVTLTVYNTLGQEVTRLVHAVEEPGYKSVLWHAGDVASGVYFYRLQAGSFVETKKLTLLR